MQGLLKSTAVVSGSTFISRIFGFIRDVLFARFFGGSGELDAFLIALRSAHMLKALFSDDVLSQSFIPILAEQKKIVNNDILEIRYFISTIFSKLILFILVIAVLGIIFSEQIVFLLAPGFRADMDKFILTAYLLNFTFPYLVFVIGCSIYTCVLHTYNHFVVPSISFVLTNLALITGTIISQYTFWEEYDINPLTGLVIALLVGGALQFSLNLIVMFKLKLVGVPRIKWHKATNKMLSLMGPALVGASVLQFYVLIDTVLASFLVEGSVSWLYYSERLFNFPLGMFGIAVSVVLLPKLSKEFVNNNKENMILAIEFSLKKLMIIIVPSSIGLVVLSQELTTSFFQYGTFTKNDMYQSSLSLIGYGLGLCAFVIIKILVVVFYSTQNAKSPVKIAIVSVFINLFLSLALISSFQHLGLALATSLAAWFNATFLTILMYKKGFIVFSSQWIIFVFKLFIASLVMLAIIFLINPELEVWQELNFIYRMLSLVAILTMSAVSYLATFWLLGQLAKKIN